LADISKSKIAVRTKRLQFIGGEINVCSSSAQLGNDQASKKMIPAAFLNFLPYKFFSYA